MTVRIIDVEGDDVTLDANHLLAGEELHFDMLLISIDNERASPSSRVRLSPSGLE